MRSRTILSALILLSLFALRAYSPVEAAVVRAYIRPALCQPVPVRADAEALGRALAGGGGAQAVWSRWMSARSEATLRVSSGDTSPKRQTNAEEAFSSQAMARGYLRGFETLAGLPAPKQQPTASVSASPTPAPLPSPSPSPTPSPTPSPVPTPTPDPAQARLAAFLQSQAAFSDHAVPANVSYNIPALPFAYVSPVSGGVSSGFGFREHPIEGGVVFHYGTDFAVQDGTSVLAFADGSVAEAGEITGYGNCVILAHADGWTTLYAHCGSLCVKAGDSVKKGDKIALSGHSGNVTGPHLHFELRHNGFYVNPEFYC